MFSIAMAERSNCFQHCNNGIENTNSIATVMILQL